jgi:FixJ family two-component response regulator
VNASAATVYVIDDEPDVCAGLSRLLRSAGWSALTFSAAQEFLDHIPTQGIGCILLDVNMPGMSGPELHQRLRELGLGFPVIYLTGKGSVPLSVEAMKRGAADFLEKPIDADLLLAAIANAVAQHRQHQAQDARVNEWKARLARLSTREREVMNHVIAGRLNKQIAGDLGIAEKTVKVHRGRVMTKIGVRSLAQLVHLCDELGIAAAEQAGKETHAATVTAGLRNHPSVESA